MKTVHAPCEPQPKQHTRECIQDASLHARQMLIPKRASVVLEGGMGSADEMGVGGRASHVANGFPPAGPNAVASPGESETTLTLAVRIELL